MWKHKKSGTNKSGHKYELCDHGKKKQRGENHEYFENNISEEHASTCTKVKNLKRW